MNILGCTARIMTTELWLCHNCRPIACRTAMLTWRCGCGGVMQEGRVVRVMKRRLIAKSLAMLKDLAKDEDATKYNLFHENFGRNLKLGLIEDKDNMKELSELIRFSSSQSGDSLTSLADYVKRMKENQKQIYFLAASSKVRPDLSRSHMPKFVCSNRLGRGHSFAWDLSHRFASECSLPLAWDTVTHNLCASGLQKLEGWDMQGPWHMSVCLICFSNSLVWLCLCRAGGGCQVPVHRGPAQEGSGGAVSVGAHWRSRPHKPTGKWWIQPTKSHVYYNSALLWIAKYAVLQMRRIMKWNKASTRTLSLVSVSWTRTCKPERYA